MSLQDIANMQWCMCGDTGELDALLIMKHPGTELRGHQACQHVTVLLAPPVDSAHEHFYHASPKVQIDNHLNMPVETHENAINLNKFEKPL